ncbi:30S ribosomal protein S6 [Patescibacteria group bacterium]|nr:30S ribosomal protein S6 [Patescibacteria group bacterium]
MRYELSFIISSAIPETEHKTLEQDILGYLEEVKAKIIKEPYFIGRKKLAYPIKKQKHGFYVFLEFDLDSGRQLKEIDTKLKHNNKLLRYLLVKLDRAAMEAATDLASLKDLPASANNKPLRRSGGRPARQVAKRPYSAPKKQEEKVNKDEKPKIALDDIDQKLDEILRDPQLD